jgi:hypothetical protein
MNIMDQEDVVLTQKQNSINNFSIFTFPNTAWLHSDCVQSAMPSLLHYRQFTVHIHTCISMLQGRNKGYNTPVWFNTSRFIQKHWFAYNFYLSAVTVKRDGKVDFAHLECVLMPCKMTLVHSPMQTTSGEFQLWTIQNLTLCHSSLIESLFANLRAQN